MKRLFYAGMFLLTIGLFFIACSNEQENVNETQTLDQGRPTNVSLDLPFYTTVFDPNSLITETGTFNFEKGGTTYTTEIIVTLDDSNGELVKISISDNFFLLNDISQGEVELAFINQVNDNGGSDDGGPRLSEHAACIQWCWDRYSDSDGNKLPGLGRCRGRCWIDTAIRVLDILAPL